MNLPEYLVEQTEESIRQRMFDNLPADLDKAEGSYIWDALSPVAIELALAALWGQEVLKRGFASTTFGSYLDLRCQEHGVTRRAAVRATGVVTFTGVSGTAIPAGARVTTPAEPVSGAQSVEFVTKAPAVIGEGGIVTADVEAVEAGVKGNVPAGAIKGMSTPVPGVASVINNLATAGGLDPEEDAGLLARYLQKVRNPGAGGNRADYINWSGEIPGVGGVSVVPVRDGNGTVSIAIIDTEGKPAGQELVDRVQNYIAPPWKQRVEAETMTTGGPGVSVVDLQDDAGSSVRMEYNAAGGGSIVHRELSELLDRPGIWRAGVSIKTDAIEGEAELLRMGVWNTATESWARTSSQGGDEAVLTLRAIDLPPSFEQRVLNFFWNGLDRLELRIDRLQGDTGAVVWVDHAEYVSTFSKDTGEAKAPVGATVTVEAARAKLINVSAALTVLPGYDPDEIKTKARAAVEQYLSGIAFQGVNDWQKDGENDVKYARIANAILDTEGVEDYTDFLVNGSMTNIPVGIQEVAVLGTVTWHE